MIKRIVKMEFKPSEIERFKSIFDQNKEKIRSVEGCRHLELWQDIHNNSVFMTYSYWDSEQDLNTYRHSDLFEEVWSNTKVLFQAKAIAWSVTTIHELN
jgi:heme-degrading monooxygenase HmoA